MNSRLSDRLILIVYDESAYGSRWRGLPLLELHYPGPRFNFQSPQGQRGYIPAEWWPDVLAAIRYATQKGVIVVEGEWHGGPGRSALRPQPRAAKRAFSRGLVESVSPH